MAWLIQKAILLIVALIAGLVVWKTDAVSMITGWPPAADPGPFPLEVYVGGVLAGLFLNEFARLNWARIGVQLALFMRSLGANAAMAAIGLGCAFIVLYA